MRVHWVSLDRWGLEGLVGSWLVGLGFGNFSWWFVLSELEDLDWWCYFGQLTLIEFLISRADWLIQGQLILHGKDTEKSYISHTGITLLMTIDIWDLLYEKTRDIVRYKPKYLLWTLCFWKSGFKNWIVGDFSVKF